MVDSKIINNKLTILFVIFIYFMTNFLECINESNSSNRQVVACAVCEEKAVSRLLTTVPRSLIKV